MDTLALWIGRIVLILGGSSLFALIVWLAIYWITYAVNNSHQRICETIAGKKWIDILRQAVEEMEENDPH